MPRPKSARTILSIGLLFEVAGCSSFQPHTAPGVQPTEARALTKSHYWRRGVDPDQFSDGEIERLFLRTREISPRDGERSEILGSQLVWALAAAGDTRYSTLLARQPPDVLHAVLDYIQPVWTSNHLDYPKTQALNKTE